MNQPIPDLTQPPPVAVPGLDVLAPAPSGLAGQVANVFEGAVGLTMAGARFANMMRERDQQEFEAQQDYQARTNKMFLDVAAEAEKQASEVFVGDAKKKWSVDRQVLSGQLQRGELPLPSDFKEETLKAWVKNTVQSRVGNGTGVYEQTYETLATDELLGMVQGAKASVLAKDQAEIVSSLASAAAIAPDAETLKRNVAQTMALTNMSERGATFAVVLPGAGEAASAGSANYETVFRPLLADKPEYALQLNALDLAWNKAKDEQAREAIRIKNAEQRDIELATQRDIKAFYDVVNSDLAANATDENLTYQRATTWLDKVRGTMARQPEKATELNALENQLKATVDSIDTKRQRIEVNKSHATQEESIMKSALSTYTSGNGWMVPDSAVTRVVLADGSVSERTVSGLRQKAQELAISSAKTTEQKVALASGDENPYQPWKALFDVGTNAGDMQFTKDGKPVVNERSIAALSLYADVSAYNPEVARKHAGKNAEWYESVLEIMREPGIGNDPAKAISEQVRRSGLGTADVPAYTPENAKQDAQKIDGIDDSNYFEVAGVLRSTYTRLVRSGVSPERAREISVSMAGSQVQVVNGHTFFAGEHATPPGAYGSFKDTAEAYLDWLKQEHPNVRAFNEPVDWDSVRFSMNQKTGKITLVSEFNQPLDIPVSQREFNVTKLLALAAQAKKNGIVARASKPKEMRKYDNGPNSIPWSKVPGAAVVGLRDFANFWDERIAKPSVAKPISFENFPIPARGPIDDALQAAGQYWDKNVAEKSRLKPVSFDYGQGQ